MAARSRASHNRAPSRVAAPMRRAPSRDPTPMRRALHAWYRRMKRDLPWRRTRDPYAIWVSEIMLQQTRVEVVAPYYRRFLQRFPEVAMLARAPLEDVLQSWAGLGYYRRARHLHAAAQRVVAEHGGRVPEAPGALEALPGIGRYTAGAIRSIAFDAPAPILDGNVARVFARFYGFDAALESVAARRQLWSWASAWAAGASPGTTNQALMELGATVCVPAHPACRRCPLSEPCKARRTHRTDAIPRPRVRPPVRRVALVAAIVRRRGRVLLVQRRSGALLQAFWELPTCTAPIALLRPRLTARFGIAIDPPRAVGGVRHRILSNALDVQVVKANATTVRRAPAEVGAARARARGATPLANLDLPDLIMKWVRHDELAHFPLSTLSRKALQLSLNNSQLAPEQVHRGGREA